MDNVIQAGNARVNITYKRNGESLNAELPDTVSIDATDGDVRQWVTEAIRTGGVPSIPADPAADFTDFVIDRFQATDARPYALFMIRPKTPFGA